MGSSSGKLSASFDRAPGWKRYIYALIAAEIQAIAAYYDSLFYWRLRPDEHGLLLEELRETETIASIEEIPMDGVPPDVSRRADYRSALVLNGAFNYQRDIQGFLEGLKPRLSRESRLIVVCYNPYLRGVFRFFTWLGLRQGAPPPNFLTRSSLAHLACLAGYELVKIRPIGFVPFRLLGLGTLLNRFIPLIPLVRWLAFSSIVVLRPAGNPGGTRPSVSIVVPARNERGNIQQIFERIPDFGCPMELILVEGNSTDGTWDEIVQRSAAYKGPMKVVTAKQTGRGKNDAVRLGFGLATHELLMILDADLTVVPEVLPRFHEAFCKGLGDFVNGSRLVYPMENEAMRFLNRLGNIFFAKALSVVLGTSISDTLCGTKLITRRDYQRLIAWRGRFGDFDPFGDFELLFAASELCLGIVDVPIHYGARTYGSTNISRFSDGYLLLRMTLLALFRLATGRAPR